eukprot:1001614-Prorocentrum_minimum.AAC.1
MLSSLVSLHTWAPGWESTPGRTWRPRNVNVFDRVAIWPYSNFENGFQFLGPPREMANACRTPLRRCYGAVYGIFIAIGYP